MQNFFEAPTLPKPPTGAPRPAPFVSARPPAEPGGRARRHWVPVAALAIVVACTVAAFWWVLATTVPTSDYDAVSSQLDRRTIELAEASDANAALETTISGLDDDIATLTAERDELSSDLSAREADLAAAQFSSADLQDRLDQAMLVSAAIAYLELDWWPDAVDDVTAAGGGASFDELLAVLGEDSTWAEWVNSNDVWRERDRAMDALDDDPLVDAWDRYWEAEVGSAEEVVAAADFRARLLVLLIESVQS